MAAVADVESQQRPNLMKTKLGKRTTRFEHGFKRLCGLTWPGYGPVLLWTITITGFFVLTVIQLNSIIYDYLNNNETIQMKMRQLKLAKNVRPNMTVCIPYYSNQLTMVSEFMTTCQSSPNSTFDFWKYESLTCDDFAGLWNEWIDGRIRLNSTSNDFQPTAVSKHLLKKAIRDFKDDLGLHTPDVKRQMLSRNQMVLDALWKYIQCLFYIDLVVLVDGIPANNTYCATYGYDVSFLNDSRLLDRLFRHVVGSMENYFTLAIPSMQNLLSRENMYREKSILFVSDKLCLPLPLDQGNYSSHAGCKTQSRGDSESGCYVFKPLNTNPWNITGELDVDSLSDGIEFFDDPISIFSPQEATFKYIHSPREDLDDENRKNTILQYSVSNRVLTKDVRNNCSDTIYIECLLQNRLNDTRELCECNPFSLTYGNTITNSSSPNLPYCSVKDYMKCAAKLESRLDATEKRCRDRCERTTFSWDTKTAPFDQQHKTPTGETIAQIRQDDDMFLEFSLTRKTSMSDFTSSIGGAINLYLGASGLTACAFIIFGIDLMKRWYRMSKQEKSDSKRNSLADSSTKGHMLWMTTAMMLRSQSRGDGQDVEDLRQHCRELQMQNQNLKDTVKRVEKALLKLESWKDEKERSRSKAMKKSQQLAVPATKSK